MSAVAASQPWLWYIAQIITILVGVVAVGVWIMRGQRIIRENHLKHLDEKIVHIGTDVKDAKKKIEDHIQYHLENKL